MARCYPLKYSDGIIQLMHLLRIVLLDDILGWFLLELKLTLVRTFVKAVLQLINGLAFLSSDLKLAVDR